MVRHTRQYYWATKRSEGLTRSRTGMKLENTMLRKRSQTHKTTHSHEMSRISKPMETECRLMVARGWGEGERGGMGMEFLSRAVRTFWNWVLEMVGQPCEYTKNH